MREDNADSAESRLRTFSPKQKGLVKTPWCTEGKSRLTFVTAVDMMCNVKQEQPLGVLDNRAENKPLIPDLGNASVGKWL